MYAWRWPRFAPEIGAVVDGVRLGSSCSNVSGSRRGLFLRRDLCLVNAMRGILTLDGISRLRVAVGEGDWKARGNVVQRRLLLAPVKSSKVEKS